MSKLNLANLAQNELSKDEAQKTKGGIICYCTCSCSCTPEYKTSDRIAAKTDDLIYLRDNPVI
jgi:natural product precursor